MRILIDFSWLFPVITGWVFAFLCGLKYSCLRRNRPCPTADKLIPATGCVFALFFVAWGIVRNL